jgi:hypothetical protein
MEIPQQTVIEIDVSADGFSYFRVVPIQVSLTDFSPPSPRLLSSSTTYAQTARILVLPANWNTGWHCSPILQLMVLLSGHVKIEVSNGETRKFGPGDLLLLRDTTGQGHRSAVVGDDAVAMLTVELPAAHPITIS